MLSGWKKISLINFFYPHDIFLQAFGVIDVLSVLIYGIGYGMSMKLSLFWPMVEIRLTFSLSI